MTDQFNTDDYTLPERIKALADNCNYKHVRVVQAVLSGKYSSHTKAYMSVYPESSQDAARDSVSKILAIPCVSALYAALRDEQLLEGILSRAETLAILSDMARTNIGDIVEFGSFEAGEDEDGQPIIRSTWRFKGSNELTPAALTSIQEVSSSAQGLKLKQHDPKAAIKQLAEMLGWNEPTKVGATDLEFVGDILKPIDEDNLKSSPC